MIFCSGGGKRFQGTLKNKNILYIIYKVIYIFFFFYERITKLQNEVN